MIKPAYKRALLKISGEALAGDNGYGIDPVTLDSVCREIVGVAALGTQVALVIGGGNIFRGLSASSTGMDRTSADYVGMLATIINAVAVHDAIQQLGQMARVYSAISMPEVCDHYIVRHVRTAMDSGRIVLCAGGTGNPYFTTDTAAALRGVELECDVLIKGTKVDGVYDKDPVKHPDAVMYDRLTYTDVLRKNLRVMDATAISLARDNKMPIIVCNLFKGAIAKVLQGEPQGTIVEGD